MENLSSYYEHKHLFKLIMLGSLGSGKTSLITRFIDDEFTEELPTIGTDLKSMKLRVNSSGVRLEIWDTAGQEQYQALTKQYYTRSQGAVAVFDMGDMSSYVKLIR